MALPEDPEPERSFAVESAWNFMVALGVVLILAAAVLVILAVAGVELL